MLSKIKTENDITEVVNQYLFKGIIKLNQESEIRSILNKVLKHPDLRSCFEQNKIVYCEQEILTKDKNIIIPDRIVLNDNSVTIIDYKTGKPAKKYRAQINYYGDVLEALNFKINKKLLVYINDEIFVEAI
jgi:ATP-dependent exoDNAse (exonuclease V) beta subunit